MSIYLSHLQLMYLSLTLGSQNKQADFEQGGCTQLCLLKTGIIGVWHCPYPCLKSWALNSGHPACTSSTLPAESSFQPLKIHDLKMHPDSETLQLNRSFPLKTSAYFHPIISIKPTINLTQLFSLANYPYKIAM